MTLSHGTGNDTKSKQLVRVAYNLAVYKATYLSTRRNKLAGGLTFLATGLYARATVAPCGVRDVLRLWRSHKL